MLQPTIRSRNIFHAGTGICYCYYLTSLLIAPVLSLLFLIFPLLGKNQPGQPGVRLTTTTGLWAVSNTSVRGETTGPAVCGPISLNTNSSIITTNEIWLYLTPYLPSTLNDGRVNI